MPENGKRRIFEKVTHAKLLERHRYSVSISPVGPTNKYTSNYKRKTWCNCTPLFPSNLFSLLKQKLNEKKFWDKK